MLAYSIRLPGQESSPPDSASVVLKAGDVIRIVVLGKPEFSGDFVIAPNGSIVHPLLREITVTGLPVPQVEQRLRAFLARYVAEPAFVVSPLLHIFVGGDVRAPATYIAPAATTMDQAVLLAGGFVDIKGARELLVLRGSQRLDLNLDVNGGRDATMLVQSGDQILAKHHRSLWGDIILPFLGVTSSLITLVNLYIILKRA